MTVIHSANIHKKMTMFSILLSGVDYFLAVALYCTFMYSSSFVIFGAHPIGIIFL